MVRILGPLQRRPFPSGTLVAGTLTPIDVDFGLSELGAVLIKGIDWVREPEAFTNADDFAAGLIARPDYAVQLAADPREPWDDPDFVLGFAYRTAFATEGGNYEQLAFKDTVPGQGILLARRATALFFADGTGEQVMGIWYHRAILSEQDLVNLVIAGRR